MTEENTKYSTCYNKPIGYNKYVKSCPPDFGKNIEMGSSIFPAIVYPNLPISMSTTTSFSFIFVNGIFKTEINNTGE